MFTTVVNGFEHLQIRREISTYNMISNIRIEKTCEWCGNKFIARTTMTRFCSKRCSEHSYKARLRNEKVQRAQSIEPKSFTEVEEKDYLTVTETATLYHFDVAKEARSAEDVEFISVADAMEKYFLTRDRLYHYVKTYKITKLRSRCTEASIVVCLSRWIAHKRHPPVEIGQYRSVTRWWSLYAHMHSEDQCISHTPAQ